MKSVRLFILLFFIPITFHAQKSLTGLWTGTLSNDSVTVRKDQSFEIVLTQYKQKVYGYSRATFIVNDTLYYIVKRVKGTIEGNKCEVTDDEIVSYNFRGKLDKKIKVTHTFYMNQDSIWSLSGNWTTNTTKKYYALSGKVDLKDEPDMDKSKIIPHLEELNLAKDVPFYVETKQKQKDEELRRIAATTRKDPASTKAPAGKPATNKPAETASKTEPEKSEPIAAIEKKPTEPVKTEPVVTSTQKPTITPVQNKPEPAKNEPVATVTQKPVVTEKPTVTEPKKSEPIATVTEQKPTITPVQNKPEPAKNEPVATVTQKPVVTEKPTTAEPKNAEPTAAVTQKPADRRTEPAAMLNSDVKKNIPTHNQPLVITATANAAVQVNERRTAPPQEVTFVSDSLVFALYDNGEIDGDTVSVLMNGELMLAKQVLKASAIKKTIYMDPKTDEVTLILYAENLGKYPPNTGLLVVYDGEERYQIRFSADLQQNASVVFRRKKK